MSVFCGFSRSDIPETAIHETTKNIREAELIIYFSKVGYFKEITKLLSSKFKNSVVIGCSSSGEISKGGIDYGLSIIAFSNHVEVKTLVIENVKEAPIIYLKELREMSKNFNKTNTVALEMTDGLSNAEEKVLSVLSAVFEKQNIPVVGASAADDLTFTKTYVACNGKVYTNASLVALIHNKNGKINIYKENIYKPTKSGFVVTKSDFKERKIFELDNKPIAKVYAQALNVPESDISDYFMSNPIGRVIGDDISISSFRRVEKDNSISFYCRVYINSYVNILEPEDPMVVLSNTISKVKNEMPSISGTIVINCIFRTLLFKNKKLNSSFVSKLSNLGQFVGLTSYGEQFNNRHFNQTMLLICFE